MALDSKTLNSLTLEQRKRLAEKLKNKAVDLKSYPMSFAQQRLWMLFQLDPQSAAYNIPMTVRLSGTLDVDVLQDAIKSLMQRHAVLRMRFATIKAKPIQIVAADGKFDFDFEDMRNIPKDEQDGVIKKKLQTVAATPFDLTKLPLFRVRLYRTAETEHVLLINMHHIISDGWSIQIFVSELTQTYLQLARGEKPQLPPLNIQYADFSAWQRKHLQGDTLDKLLGYWTDKLAGLAPVIDLPTDFTRPAVKGSRGGSRTLIIPKEIHCKLKAIVEKSGVTPFIFYLAAFQAYLYRLTNQDDIAVGTPIANRNRKEIEPLIGFFVNSLVIRGLMDGKTSFLEFLQATKKTAFEAYAHQDVPFEMIVEKLAPERDMSRTPLYQVSFAYAENSSHAIKSDELTLTPFEMQGETAKFDITASVTLSEDELSCTFVYDADLFEAASIDRMLDQFHVLLGDIAVNPEKALQDLSILSDNQVDALLSDLRSERVDYPQTLLFHQGIEAWAQKTPEAIAASFENDTISFFELNRRANQIANYLRAQGVGPEDFVGLYMDRSIEMIVAIAAIIKAGAAYVPSDSKYPKERLAFMYNGCVKAIVTLSDVRDHLDDIEETIPILSLDHDGSLWDNESDENPENVTQPQHPAYAIFTSGSTGTPKGVVVQHDSLLNLAYNLKETVYDDLNVEQARISLNAPLAFDASVQQVVMLMFGHGLHIVPQDYRADGRALRQFVARHELHVVDCVPSQLKVMIQEGFLDDDLWRPQAMLPGGEAIDETMWKAIAESDIRFFNMYGPTECTVDSTVHPVLPEQKKPVIGRAVKNADFYVLDPRQKMSPVGVPGELYIAGAGLARGYLDRPDLTAERFLPDPYNESPGARMYKTGDLVRLLPDGQVEFLGRTDFQVKVRGFRIELEEIEHAIRTHPHVQDVLVVVHQDGATANSIVAYVIPAQEELDTTELRDSIRSRLPNYMIPTAFVLLEKFPLMPNGKINRHALPKPDYSELQDEFVEPSTPTEETLAAIFAEVLELESISARANFFESGGHSLLATQVLSRIRQVFKLEMPLRALFEYPTVVELARAVDAALQDHGGQQRPPIAPAPDDVTPPLSFAQQRMWFLDQLEPKNPQYNIPDAVRIKGALDIERLTACIQEVVDRHEVLRTAFVTVDGKPQLSVIDPLVVQIPVIDISELNANERETQAQHLIHETATTGFDLSTAPLFRIRLIKLAESDYILASTMHHSISDGWSFGILIREVGQLYDRRGRGDDTPLPPLPLQYADFAHWQRHWLQGETLDNEINYWKEQLGETDEVLDLPTDHKRPSFQTTHGAHVSFQLSKELTQKVNALAGQENVTLFMTLLAAFQTLLQRYTRQDSVAVGSPIANRNQSELEPLIGFFVNTLVLKTDLSGNPTFKQVLQRVKDVTLGAYAHQDVPFEKLVDALQPDRDTSHTPLFQVMFLLQNLPSRGTKIAGLEFEQFSIETHTSNFDLTLAMEEHNEQLIGSFEYNTDLFEASTIQRMIAHLTNLLQGIVEHPDAPIHSHELMPEDEKYRILTEWNATEVEYTALPLHHLVEQQVERTPDAVAVKLGDAQLTYAELDRRANQVAHVLIQQQVKPDDLVGLCIDRSLDMIVGLLGILKSGAGYLPLDPDYPTERMEFMLNDAEVQVILTEDKLASRFSSTLIPLLRLDADWPQISAASETSPHVSVELDNLAYAIYTSGSTGVPKGVLVTHRGVVNHNNAVRHEFGYTPQDKELQFFSLNFDGAVEEIFPTLMSGATLVLRPAGVVLSVDEYLTLAQKEQVTILDMPTAYWHELAFELDAYGKSLPPSVRLVLTGGEAASPERYAQWSQRVGDQVQWLNTYGPTEGTIIATWYDPAQNEHHDMESMPIGNALPNYKLYILDDNLNPTPIGVPGELCIGGAGVVRGYLNRPDLTAEKFIPDPWNNHGARLYRTGDLARFNSDGNIEFFGRVDDQVKIRGFRVELGEIESQLRKHAAVREVAVVARRDGSQNKLAAYYVTEPENEVPPDELRDFLKDQMPDYMVPHALMSLAELPKMISGKIDRKALPAPEYAEADAEELSSEPKNATEETLLAIFKDVLGHDSISTQRSFFELGGDSIMSIQLIAKANQAGLRLTPKQLFENPTIASLATVAGQGPAVVAEQGRVEGEVPLTPIQHWFFEREFTASHHWNQSLLLRVNDSLDREALQRAVDTIVEHHDMFRARYHKNSTWQQSIVSEHPSVLQYFDFSDVDESAQAQHIEKTCAELQASFDLEQGPLLAVAQFELGSTSRLFIAVHHLVMDGVSWRILLEDIQTAYTQAQNDQEIVLPAKTTSFQYWAQQLKEFAQSRTVAEDVAYWTHYERQLVGAVPVDFPEQRIQNLERDARTLNRALSVKETQSILNELPTRFDARINDVLLTALLSAYTQWSGKRSLLIDMEGHGREMLFEDADVSRTMGWFTVLYPLFLKASRAQNIEEAVHSVKSQVQQVPRQGISYGVLRYMSEDETIRQKMAAMPTADISFNYLGQFDRVLDAESPFQPAPESKGSDRHPEAQRENLMDVTISVAGEQMHVNVTYNSTIHRQETIQRFLDLYMSELGRLLSPPQQRDAQPSSTPSATRTMDKRQLGKVLGQLNKGKGNSI